MSQKSGSLLLLIAASVFTPAFAQIAVDGLNDRQVYPDRVTFRVPSEPGYNHSIHLDSRLVAPDTWVEVTTADYHELLIERTPASGGSSQNRLLRFIIRSSERGNSEWGLPPWTPWPVVNSAPEEFSGLHLEVVVPPAFPAGFDIPIVAWVEDELGRRPKLNGEVASPGFESIQLRRGIGSGFLPAAAQGGVVQYQAALAELHSDRRIAIEPAPAWRPFSGVITGQTFWPAQSRWHLTNDLVLPSDAVLVIGPGTILKIDPLVNLDIRGRAIIQRCITAGEYEGGSVTIQSSALLEFPEDTPVFADEDNDAIYLTIGQHFIRDSLIGWAKDDGIDAGSGGAGSVLVTNCWIEACFHEGMAWSGAGRVAEVRDTVVLNCGQGIEAGYSIDSNSPLVFADHILSLGNATGARFGDNYDWTYNGFLRVTNSFLLYNYRNIFGRTWADNAWTNELDQMSIEGNSLSAPDANHPLNTLWQPEADGSRLADFLDHPAAAPVGLALLTPAPQIAVTSSTKSFTVGLSRFSPVAVQAAYHLESESGATLASGQIHFQPGETVKTVPLETNLLRGAQITRLKLSQPSASVLTGPDRIYFLAGQTGDLAEKILIAPSSVWLYSDAGTDLGTAWRALDFSALGWKSGQAELGFGDESEGRPERTRINGGPNGARFPTIYFRRQFEVENLSDLAALQINLLRDDGAVVWLNQLEAFRSNMPEGPISFPTLAQGAAASETAYLPAIISPDFLVSGPNVCAVEVHQSSSDSSDLSFDLGLSALPRRPAPRLRWARFPDEDILVWREETAVLEMADRIEGPWVEIHAATSPAPIPSGNATRFFRLRTQGPPHRNSLSSNFPKRTG